uniref:Uncharacterized protein n=1 Tax=Macaca fascicularis TaxID=9541 RepID=Q95K86_MACFA|nr:hypothetical protein [Macaca fascicularis]
MGGQEEAVWIQGARKSQDLDGVAGVDVGLEWPEAVPAGLGSIRFPGSNQRARPALQYPAAGRSKPASPRRLLVSPTPWPPGNSGCTAPAGRRRERKAGLAAGMGGPQLQWWRGKL